MLSVPSSRRLACLALVALLITSLLRLVVYVVDIEQKDILNRTIQSYIINILPVTNTAFTTENLTLTELYVHTYHKTTPSLRPNHHIKALSQSCSIKPNPHTNHIRLPYRLQNISLIPSNDTQASSRSFFNPTFIPLPATYSASSPQYLLLTRLVTAGSHQESHLCLASICIPPHLLNPTSSGLPTCTSSDLDLLGPHGGMRCITDPIRLDVPPTPARYCTGNWMTFTDIPGFHDPRVFWGGGAPLVLVNSGSAAPHGCVGLWIQDLRSLVPGLEEVLAKGKHRTIGDHEVEAAEEHLVTGNDPGPARRGLPVEEELGDGWDKVLQEAIEAKLLFPRLTEITRNPTRERKEVEKNWVVFFPTAKEAVVQYELMGQVQRADVHNVSYPSRSREQEDEHTGALLNGSVIYTFTPTGRKNTTSEISSLPSSSDSAPLQPIIGSSMQPASEPHSPESILREQHAYTITGGRSLSELFTHGRTSPNLTSPLEQPCFDLTSHAHTHDTLNNTGRWHQGSNALRLILSTRPELRSLYNEFTALSQQRRGDRSVPANEHESNTNAEGFEDWLVEDGRIVHFSIVHRKFVNEWKLPMRYERYFVVWEARRPYRVVGVSRWPVLFGGERARPWAREHDMKDAAGLGRDGHNRRDESGHEVWPDEVAYFTYSPSIAWAWRPIGDDDEGASTMIGGAASVFGDLGTGYMGDDILIGVGLDDHKQGFVRVQVDEVLQCLRLCPGVEPE